MKKYKYKENKLLEIFLNYLIYYNKKNFKINLIFFYIEKNNKYDTILDINLNHKSY